MLILNFNFCGIISLSVFQGFAELLPVPEDADTVRKLTDPRADEQQENNPRADIHQYGSHEKVLFCHIYLRQGTKKAPVPGCLTDLKF
jgi:hypothetical protein